MEITELEKTKAELETLKSVVREYLKMLSLDGRPARQVLRKQLAEMTKVPE